MRFLVGGRFTCLTCLRRGIAEYCRRCGHASEIVDLGTETGRRRLALRRAAGPIGRAGRSVWDFAPLRYLPAGRRLIWIGTRLSFLGGFSVAILSSLMPSSTNLFDAMTHLFIAAMIGFAAVGTWIATVAFAVMVALGTAGVIAQILVAAAAIVSAIARVAPGRVAHRAARAWLALTETANRDVMQRALDLVERLFVPRVRVEEIVMAPTSMRFAGVIRSEFAMTATSSETGSVDVRDAIVTPFELELADGTLVLIDVTIGTIEYAGLLEAQLIGRATLPEWTDLGPDDRIRARVASIGKGTRVIVEGGTIFDEIDASGTHAGFRSSATRRVIRGQISEPVAITVTSGAL